MNPFSDTPPLEVPLPRAPLVRVLCQLRFPTVLSIGSQEFVAPFQEQLRKLYPVLRQEQTEGFVVGPNGFAPAKAETAWRFSDLNGTWRVSLAPTFLALETTKYASRGEFMDRLREVVLAAKQHVEPAAVDRLGLRYVDRVRDEAMTRLPQLLRPQVLGAVGGELTAQMSHCVTESAFEVGAAQMLARWGYLPAQVTMDPNVMEPIDSASWILDLDMFSKPGETMPFNPDEVVTKVGAYAERTYAFFRWCVTDEFLRYYGGQP